MKNLIPFLLLILLSCTQESNEPLPILGERKVVNGDTLYHQIPEYSYINQDSIIVTHDSLKNFIYLSDFFFTSCPSICPVVKKQMLRLYDKYKDIDKIRLVSHTIDPKRDTPEKLKKYARDLKVDDRKWMFLTGDKEELLDMADEYFVTAYEDPDAPGGFDHSGLILLVDTNRHIRAFAQGTDPEDVTELFGDIEKLLDEYKVD